MLLLSWRFWRFTVRRFFADRCLQVAGVLSYTTLLAVVPLATVVLGLLAAFPISDGVQERMETFVFRHFMPATGEAVQTYLLEFAARARRLTVPGAVVLIVTSVLTLATIDEAFNRIWRSRTHRRGLAGFLTYWSILSLGPILILASVVLSSYLFSLPALREGGELRGLTELLLGASPFLLATAAITLLYVTVPQERVRFSSALTGGVIAAISFELAKRGFAIYVSSVPSYEIIYGAFATVPLFMLWIYTVWCLLLLGAQVACALERYEEETRAPMQPRQRLFLAMRLLGHLHDAAVEGHTLDSNALTRLEPKFSLLDVEDALADLEGSGYVAPTADQAWVVKRDLHRTTVATLMKALYPEWPPEPPVEREPDARDRRLAALIARADEDVDRAMDISVAEVLAAAPEREGEANPAEQAQDERGTGAVRSGPFYSVSGNDEDRR